MVTTVTTRRSLRTAVIKARESPTDPMLRRSTRSRRTAVDNSATATVLRGHRTTSSLSPESMRLTVKAPSSKLREATRTSGGREQFVGGEIIEGKRPRHVKKSYVVESDSEDEDEDEEMDDVVDDEEEEEEEEDDEDMDGEEDEEADADADGDMDIDVAPPPPTIKVSKARGGKPIVARQPPKGSTIAVQPREVQLVSDDEELSELESEVAEEEAMQTGNEEEEVEEEDEDEDEIDVEAEEDEEDDMDSDDDTGMGGSRASTPDLNKLTKRQRARLEEGGSGHLLALPDGKCPPHMT